jgi:divalent metal cation (Fe/Co/Zn/Cd) transporter
MKLQTLKPLTPTAHLNEKTKSALLNTAMYLAVFTIVYNVVEGIIATVFGYEDESLTLFGFGSDSFIEVISGIGIAHMIYRIRKDTGHNRDNFERRALRITGFAFYLLVLTLLGTGIYNLYSGNKPLTTTWGIIISSVSIVVMWGTIVWKTRIGKALNSEAILADAECARVCIYMSFILLLSSGIYALTGFQYTDVLGTFGLAYFSFREGRECFEKAASDTYCSCGHP